MIPAVSQEDTFAVPSIANTIAIRILRSPLNGLLSHNTLLLSFQGCKSGKTYTIPLRYAQEADTVLCFTHRGNTWWKNLRGDTPVTVDLKGRSLPGIASAVADDQTMIEHEMYTFLLQLPGDATYKGVRLTPDGTPNRTDIAAERGSRLDGESAHVWVVIDARHQQGVGLLAEAGFFAKGTITMCQASFRSFSTGLTSLKILRFLTVANIRC